MTESPDWKCPGSTRIAAADADRREWIKARNAGIGASEIASVLQIDGSYSSRYDVWVEKTITQGLGLADTEVLRMGRDIEDVVAARFTEQTGIATRRHGLARSKAHPFLLATVDRLTADGGVLECKVHTPYAKAVSEWKRGDVPAKFWWQVQQQMLVTGRAHGHLAALIPGVAFHVVRVDADEAAFERIIREGREFWDHVEADLAPPVDPHTVTDDELKARWPHVVDAEAVAEAAIPEAFVDMYRQRAYLKTREKETTDAIKAIDAQIKDVIGGREYLAADGRALFRWREIATTRFDAKAFASDHPDLHAEYMSESSYRRLDPIKNALTRDTESEAAA